MRKGQKMTLEQRRRLSRALRKTGAHAEMIICDCPQMHVVSKNTLRCPHYKEVKVWDIL